LDLLKRGTREHSKVMKIACITHLFELLKYFAER